MSDRIEAEILDVLGEEVAAAVDTPLVVIEGPKGDPGAPGKDGHSPVVTATKSGKTTTISVDGAAIATVEDGADGKPGTAGADGVTPHIGDNGNWYLGAEDTGKPSRGEKGEKGDTGAAGPRGETGPQGTPGKDGANGKDGKPGEKGADGAPGVYYGTTQPTGDTHPVWLDPDGDHDDGGLLPAVNAADNGKVLRVVNSAWSAEDMPTGGTDMGITGAKVGQIAKIAAVDASGVPTAWAPVDMPSGGGHWETVLDTVWEQDVINPTAFDSETGIFTCAEGELDDLELGTEYIFFQQCAKEGVAYNTILKNEIVKVTKLSETTFSIDVTPPTTFVPTNVKFSRGACLAITDIDARRIRFTLDGQFSATATNYNNIFFGAGKPYFALNTFHQQIRNAYQAYQQVTAEVESPYRIVGEILCGFNAPSQNASFHFKNNSFCCPLVPYDVPKGNERNNLLTSDGTKIAKLYSTGAPWFIGGANENTAIGSDYLKIISGTKVKLERWVE